MLFVGLDVIGGFVTEINVTSPTGIRELDKQFGTDIGRLLLDAILRRLEATRAPAALQRCARRVLALREGRPPVRDRLLAMLFFARCCTGWSSSASPSTPTAGDAESAPGLEVLLVSDELPEARQATTTATYLAQRTQLGSGNTARIGRAAQSTDRARRRCITRAARRATRSRHAAT